MKWQSRNNIGLKSEISLQFWKTLMMMMMMMCTLIGLGKVLQRISKLPPQTVYGIIS
jgi:hypothetical protein